MAGTLLVLVGTTALLAGTNLRAHRVVIDGRRQARPCACRSREGHLHALTGMCTVATHTLIKHSI